MVSLEDFPFRRVFFLTSFHLDEFIFMRVLIVQVFIRASFHWMSINFNLDELLFRRVNPAPS